MDPRQAIHQAYARWSRQYDDEPNPTRDAAVAVLARLLPPLADLDVLELGAGTGQSTSRLLGARSLVALDFSEEMLSKARLRLAVPELRFIRHDLCEPLPFADSEFDLVTENLVFEHVQDLAPVLSEAFRVLRPGGRLVVIELHPYRQLAGKQACFEADGQTVLVPAFLHSASELVTLALGAGFAIVHLGEWSDHGEPFANRAGVMPRISSLVVRRD